MLTARDHIVREATDVVLRRLERLAPSERTEQLRVWLDECLRQAEVWGESPPAPRDRDVLMKRVLALHVEVTRLERERQPGQASA
jgi:hypothetical protein